MTRRSPSRSRVWRASLGAAVLAATVLLGACSSGGTPELSEDQANDPALVTGRQVYQARCARCHGGDGGGGAGPKLAGNVVKRYPEPSQQEEVVRDGRGSMPSFDDALSDDEIEAVVRFTREVL